MITHPIRKRLVIGTFGRPPVHVRGMPHQRQGVIQRVVRAVSIVQIGVRKGLCAHLDPFSGCLGMFGHAAIVGCHERYNARRMKNPVLILALALSGGALLLGLWSWQQWNHNRTASHTDWAVATVIPKGRLLPPVTLIDQDGQPFHFAQVAGQWRMLFFGFTHCPDICPNTLALLKAVKDSLVAEQYPELQMILVSVDPQRDNPDKLRDYVRYFDPKMLGLTGEEASLQTLTAGLYLPYQVGEADMHGNYSVDHSASLVLVSPDNQVRAYFSAPHQIDALLTDLRRLLKS